MQDCSLSHHLLDMVLGLRENEKDVCDTAFNEFRKLSVFIQSTTQNERQGIENRIS